MKKGIAAIVAMVLAILLLAGCSSKGKEKYVVSDYPVTMTADRDANERYMQALLNKNDAAIDVMFIAGDAFEVEGGDKVLVLDNDGLMAKVQVLTGRSKGRIGLIYKDRLK